MDIRVKYTKKIITESFIELLKESNIDSISVTDICKKAEVNRTTFYRYYENQYDLLSKMEDELLLQIREDIKKDKSGVDDALLILLTKMSENKELWCLIFNNHTDNTFQNKIGKFFEKTFKFHKESKERQMLNIYTTSGTSGIIRNWFVTGMNESPSELCTYITKFRRILMEEYNESQGK